MPCRETTEVTTTETEVSKDPHKHAQPSVNLDRESSLDRELTLQISPEHEQTNETSHAVHIFKQTPSEDTPTEHIPHQHDIPELKSPEHVTPEPKSPEHDITEQKSPEHDVSLDLKTAQHDITPPVSPEHDVDVHDDIPTKKSPEHDIPEHDTTPEHDTDIHDGPQQATDVTEQITSEVDEESEQDKMEKTAAVFVEQVLSGIGKISVQLQPVSPSSKSELKVRKMSETEPSETTSPMPLLDLSDAPVKELTPEQTDSEPEHPEPKHQFRALHSKSEVCM